VVGVMHCVYGLPAMLIVELSPKFNIQILLLKKEFDEHLGMMMMRQN
jgi:hypothetical protein